jgi:hypothetical protein
MKKLIIYSLLALCLWGCEKDKELVEKREPVEVEGTEFPAFMRLGDAANLKIYIAYRNPCARFSDFEQQDFLDSTRVAAFAFYNEVNCLSVRTLDSVYLNFEAKRLGQYYFRFVQPDGSRFVDSILVK